MCRFPSSRKPELSCPSRECTGGKIARICLEPVIFALSPFLRLFTILSDNIIWRVLGRTYIYNVSWEDPRVDHKQLKLTEDDRVITLASAGDNALDYVIEGAAVSAIDFNPCQIALAELKSVAVQQLDWEDAFAIFGQSDIALLRSHYRKRLRHHLAPASQSFWDERVNENFNFMYSGTSGLAAWVLVYVILPILGLGFIRGLVKAGVSKEELHAEVTMRFARIRFAALVMDCVLAPLLHPLLGVPASQAKLGTGRDSFFEIACQVLFDTDLVRDNYFYAGYLLGHYTKENCPRYLQEKHFATLKENLKAGKLTLFCGTIEEYVVKSPPGTFTVASLLDHLDWMTPAAVNEELDLLIQHMDQSRGRIFWRSFGLTVVSSTPSMVWLDPKPVDCQGDRVLCYFSTWVVYLKDTTHTMVARCRSWKGKSALSDRGVFGKAKVGLQLVTYPVGKKIGLINTAIGDQSVDAPRAKSLVQDAHSREMEAFYASQKEGYDLFREDLLPGRACMVNLLPMLKNKNGDQKMVWVDVGGGTARNLEFFPLDTLREFFSRIFIVDVSPSLLQMARARIEAAGLTDIVSVVQQDFTTKATINMLCGEGKADIVTFSYSLSMIPHQEAALKNASRLLKPGRAGTLAIADFFLRGPYDSLKHEPTHQARKLEAAFQRWWFKQDGVHLLGSKTLSMIDKLGEKVIDTRFRKSVPFLPLLRPFHGVVMISST